MAWLRKNTQREGRIDTGGACILFLPESGLVLCFAVICAHGKDEHGWPEVAADAAGQHTDREGAAGQGLHGRIQPLQEVIVVDN